MVDHDRSNGHRSPERLEDELRQTRRAMDETLDELSAHLEPRRMVNEAWHTIREHLPSGERASHVAKEAGRDLTRRIGAHPLPAALIGAGVVWLIIEEAMGESVRGEHASRAAGVVRDKAQNVADRMGQRASHMGDKASGLAHDAASRISDTTHDMAEGMQRRAQTASEHVSRAASKATSAAADGARRTADATADAYESRPLLFGALAIAAGLAAGIAAPKTRAERRVLGDAGEDLRHEASEMARRTGHRVMDAAKETAVEGVERVADAVESEADRAADKAEVAADKSDENKDSGPATWMPADAGRPPVEPAKQSQLGPRPVNRP